MNLHNNIVYERNNALQHAATTIFPFYFSNNLNPPPTHNTHFDAAAPQHYFSDYSF